MVIGIDASRAFLRNRTGIEEYAYQVIAHLRDPLGDERVILYVRTGQGPDFELPELWEVKALRASRFWTHIRLSLEMLLHRPDVLFVPAHTIPIIHPRSIVTIHGLEYEFSPESYSWWERFYMRAVILFSCRVAETVIAVSENTKRDLIRLYKVSAEKIRVVYEGRPERQITDNMEQITEDEAGAPTPQSRGLDSSPQAGAPTPQSRIRDSSPQAGERGGGTISNLDRGIERPYLLSVGRIEERKNVRRIVEAFDILKKRHRISHRLVLAGKPGYGYADVRNAIEMSGYRSDIIEMGYVDESTKVVLLAGADVFIFPSLYEGFGLPVVEAQSAGVPVVTSNVSSLPEIGGEGALYADPLSAESIADRIWEILSDPVLRSGILEKGRINAERFDWGKCARDIADTLRKDED
ncbi:MAG: glycosyltransferase family 1 protein [Candidatus Moraniibacteriota bacterium]